MPYEVREQSCCNVTTHFFHYGSEQALIRLTPCQRQVVVESIGLRHAKRSLKALVLVITQPSFFWHDTDF